MQDVWHVRLASGEVRNMTLDELDAAYQAGAIDEHTAVCEDGGEWKTLGALLGIEPAVDARPNTIVPPASVPPTAEHGPSLRPMATDLEDLDEHQLRPKRRGVFIGAALAAALVIGGVALAVTKVGSTPETSKAAAVGANAPAAIVVAPVNDPEVADRPALSEDQRRALAQKDKELAAKAAKAKEERDAKQRTFRPATKSGPVFHQGGDPHDPLNAKL